MLSLLFNIKYLKGYKGHRGLPQWLSGKESACNVGDTGDLGLISELGRSPGGGHGSPFQYSCWENPMNRGGWQATFHGVAKSQTQLRDYTTTMKNTEKESARK